MTAAEFAFFGFVGPDCVDAFGDELLVLETRAEGFKYGADGCDLSRFDCSRGAVPDVDVSDCGAGEEQEVVMWFAALLHVEAGQHEVDRRPGFVDVSFIDVGD